MKCGDCALNCSVVLMKTCTSSKEAAQKGELPLDAIEALGDILTKCEINGMDKWDKGQDRNIFEFYATMHDVREGSFLIASQQ